MSKLIDLTGQTFENWTVIEKTQSQGKYTMWLCKCKCGTLKAVNGDNLKSGKTSSCGCTVKGNSFAKTHGEKNTRLYKIWIGIKTRCYNSKEHNYTRYGARGITMCDEWLQDYTAFRNWALSHGYGDSLTIDRIDVNGNYEPNNCRWTTKKEQANNKRNNHLITYNGKTQTLAQWSEELGINYKKLEYRINRSHWSIEKALSTP